VSRRILAVVVAGALAAGCGHETPKGDQTPTTRRGSPVIVGAGRLVDVGGHSLYVNCMGSGSPTVVLEAGFGGNSSNWRDVQPQLGQATRTCAYDRAGLGNSVATPGVHDAGDEIDDLQRLLDHAHIPPPYVLVGHSYGGLLARLFAHSHANETAGVVLVDAVGRDTIRRQLAIWPRSQAPTLRRAWAKPVFDRVDLRAGEALADRVRTLGQTPLAVVTAGRPDGGPLASLPPRLLRDEERLWMTMQAELAALSTDHVHGVALRSGHFVQRLDGQPLVVIQAVRAVVDASRDHTRLPPCQRLFTGPNVRCLSG
jgi:pimeloyl-ACP methyl ester carboxylesterase